MVPNMTRPSASGAREGLAPPREYRFSPTVGPWYVELARIGRVLSSDPDSALRDIDSEIQAVMALATASLSSRPLGPFRLRFAFCLSLLHDILSVGGRVRVMDSEIFVSWPDWSASEGRPVVRRALTLLAGQRSVTEADRRQFQKVFAPPLNPHDIVRFLASGRFRL